MYLADILRRYMKLNKTSYVILGMLRLGRHTGYDIKQLVDVSTRFFWAASYGQIYPELARLEEARLVRGESDEASGRRRRTYELTPAGEDALDAWLTSDEPLHFELRHEGILKLFFSDGLAPEERAARWRSMREVHERQARQLRTLSSGPADAAVEEGKRMPREVLDFGIAHQDFIVDYCKRMEAKED
jgi:PadR family transcriptional regulator, regulatory protein AphA